MLLSKSTLSKSKYTGQANGEFTCSSGYMADASSARTPGDFLLQSTKKESESCSKKEEDVSLKNKDKPSETPNPKMGRPLPEIGPEVDVREDVPNKRAKMNLNFVTRDDRDDEDEEPTGFFNGIMSEFQKGAGLLPSNKYPRADFNKLLVQSSQKSKKNEMSLLQAPANNTLQNISDISTLAGGATPSRSILQ